MEFDLIQLFLQNLRHFVLAAATPRVRARSLANRLDGRRPLGDRLLELLVGHVVTKADGLAWFPL